MNYELQVHALSPLAPTPRELVARATMGGLALDLDGAVAGSSALDDVRWTGLALRATEAHGPAFNIGVSDQLERLLAGFREDAAAGETVPELVFSARRAYLLELPPQPNQDDEVQAAAFALVAWALASLTDAIVFDPQEEFFADADSFWGLMDGSLELNEPAVAPCGADEGLA